MLTLFIIVKNVTIGAGTVLIRSIEDNHLTAGAPAKVIKVKK